MWSLERVWALRVRLYFVVQLKMVGAGNLPRNVYANPHSNLHNFNIKTKIQRLHLLARTFVGNLLWRRPHGGNGSERSERI